MRSRTDGLVSHLYALEDGLSRLVIRAPLLDHARVTECLSHAAALRFHLADRGDRPVVTAILGGTGTGKSTLLNRLLGEEVSAASLRRTFTNGPVAVVGRATALPQGWPGGDMRHTPAKSLPSRGEWGVVTVITIANPLLDRVTLVDTPDLDGDEPRHHAMADRVFRWAEAIIFVVTPEKYQMTEWQGYERLARRYALPCLFVLNKCEDGAVSDDLVRQLADRGRPDARVFILPRDDSAYEPAPGQGLADLRAALKAIEPPEPAERSLGLAHRRSDLAGRIHDAVLGPLRAGRETADRLIAALRALIAPAPAVDVSPLTRQLQRRLEEQSVLYLIGPRRILDRARQVGGLLRRLPRTAWGLLAGQAQALPGPDAGAAPSEGRVPDFVGLLTDQFRVIQSRMDDLLRSDELAGRWLETQAEAYQQVWFDPGQAGDIARQELAELNEWLRQRWHTAPRDTRAIERLLKILPGGKALTPLSELAPYILTIVLVTHGAFFGPIDLLVLGGFSLTTWLGERLSNEVTSRTRRVNRRIGERFEQLARDQIERVCQWLTEMAPPRADIDRLEQRVADLAADGEA